MCEMYKLKIGDYCWEMHHDISQVLTWSVNENCMLREDEYTGHYKRLVKTKTINSKLIKVLFSEE